MSDFAAYRRVKAVNASSLKAMSVSPLHYRHGLTNDRPDSPAMAKGRAIHTAVLQPSQFRACYAVWPGAKRGKDWVEFKAEADLAGRDVLTQDEYDDVLATRKAVRAHPLAREVLNRTRREVTLKWTDAATGLKCKARCDAVSKQRRYVADLKTARAIDPRTFDRQTHDLLYHVQCAHYVAGAEAVYGSEFQFWFVAVESAEPHDVRVGPMSGDALYAGEQERRRLLDLVAECTESGHWPGAYPSESEFDLPDWYYSQGERKLEGLA